MAIPVFTGPYDDQASLVDDGVSFNVAFADGSSGSGWSSNATVFDVHTLPPGFTFDGQTLGGDEEVNMTFYLFVRAGNVDGFSDWVPLKWVVTGLTTARTLYGLSLDWELIHASGAGAVMFLETIDSVGGDLLINDSVADGNASGYGTAFRDSQIILNGVANTFLRAPAPGFSVLVDTSV